MDKVISKEYDEKTFLEELDKLPYPWYEKLWDNIDYYTTWVHPSFIKRKIKYFYQKLTRGFDDSEIWSIDYSFYDWILPRLKRYTEVIMSYPERCGSLENWINEINERIIQLERIVNNTEYSFPYHEYLTEKDKEKIKEIYGNEIVDMPIYCHYAYWSCREDFNEWWKNNMHELWW